MGNSNPLGETTVRNFPLLSIAQVNEPLSAPAKEERRGTAPPFFSLPEQRRVGLPEQ